MDKADQRPVGSPLKFRQRKRQHKRHHKLFKDVYPPYSFSSSPLNIVYVQCDGAISIQNNNLCYNPNSDFRQFYHCVKFYNSSKYRALQ